MRIEKRESERGELEMDERKENIDSLKAVCAFLIVCIHVSFPGVIGEYFAPLTRIGVPIFFMITGYFYFDIVMKQKQYKQIQKLFRLFIISNIIYILWDLLRAIVECDIEQFTCAFSWKSIIKLLIFNEAAWGGGTFGISAQYFMYW